MSKTEKSEFLRKILAPLVHTKAKEMDVPAAVSDTVKRLLESDTFLNEQRESAVAKENDTFFYDSITEHPENIGAAVEVMKGPRERCAARVPAGTP